MRRGRLAILAAAALCGALAAGGRAEEPPAPAADANYRIGPGDVVEVRVLGEDQMGTTARVSNAGFIRVPFVEEDVRAQCLTERELAAAVERRLRKYLKYPEVHVAVKEFNSSPVAVIGAVTTPGRFQMQREVSLLELLVLAGGPSAQAGKVLHVIHSGPVDPCAAGAAEAPGGAAAAATETVSLTRLMGGDVSENRVMRPGDIVIVPNADLVFIAGEVFKPNAYPLREGLTLTQLLALAGGPTGVAKVDSIRIVRQSPGKPREEVAANLKDIQKNRAADPPLMPNDVVEVPSSTGKQVLNRFLTTIGASAGQIPVRVIP
jgi:polysaccharide export outer membrane protein